MIVEHILLKLWKRINLLFALSLKVISISYPPIRRSCSEISLILCRPELGRANSNIEHNLHELAEDCSVSGLYFSRELYQAFDGRRSLQIVHGIGNTDSEL